MSKFKQDYTKCGAIILSLFGPDTYGEYAGVVENSEGEVFGVSWDEDGREIDRGSFETIDREDEAFTLVPLSANKTVKGKTQKIK